MKKKHLQFNDITAPSLARRAARRRAEKGESGRMEPGVINVFFSYFPLKKQHWILLILFIALHFSIPSCYFLLLSIVSTPLSGWNYLLFYSDNLSFFLPTRPSLTSDFWSQERSTLAWSPPLCLSLSLFLFVSVWLHQSTMACLHNKAAMSLCCHNIQT